jgi:signal recognition particle subunit SEC65
MREIAVVFDSSEATVIRVSKELGRLKGNLKYLWELSKQSPLDRDSCKNALLEIRKSFRLLLACVQDIILESLRGLKPREYTILSIFIGKSPEEWVKEFFKGPSYYESEISMIISFLDQPEYYKDNDIKDRIASLVEKLEVSISELERKLSLKQGVAKISEFLATFPQFTENWSVAICYLTAMEIMVRRKLKELGVKPTGQFKNVYETLLAKLKDKGIEVSELEKQLPKIFWDIRNKVVHEGYSPTSEELEIIIKYIEKILTLITSLK